MKILRAALSAVVLLPWALSLTAQTAPAEKSFGEQVEVNIVNVEVYVTGDDGRPVSGLQRGDFALLEDGKPMEIVNFEAVDRTAVAAAPVPATTLNAAPAVETGIAQAAPPAVDPLHLVVFVDNTHIATGHRTRVLRQLRDFLTRLTPGDDVLLATYDPGLHVRLPFTADRAALARALDTLETVTADNGGDARSRRAALQQVIDIQERAAMAAAKQGMREDAADARAARRGGGGDDSGGEAADPGRPEADTLCPSEIAEPVKAYAGEARQEILRSITGLTVLVNSLSGLPGRKALLHVSDGLAVTPGEELFQVLAEMCGGGGATSGVPSVDASVLSVRTYRASQAMLDSQGFSTAKQWNDLAAHASAQRVTLYTLQATGLEAGAASAADMGPGDRLLQLTSVANIERENRRGSLNALASGTGGRAIFDANDLAPDIARISDDLNHYYSLGYTPQHNGDGREHKIAVKLQRPGVRVRYRQLYRDKPPLERVVDRTLAALFLGTGDNPLGVSLQVGDMTPASAAGSIVPIRVLIPLNNVGLSLHGATYDGKVRVFVATQTAGGGNSAVRQMEVPLHIPMENSQATMMQSYLYEVKLQLPPGEHRVAVGVRDDVTTLASYLTQKVQVAGGAAK
jgi:VWFA-related protein